MKRFSLEEYLANPDKEVITRNGNPVRIICTDRESSVNQPVVALVKVSDLDEVCNVFSADGSFYEVCGENPLDLFFKTTKREGWVNIFSFPAPEARTDEGIYDSYEEAKSFAKNNPDAKYYVATVNVEWEE